MLASDDGGRWVLTKSELATLGRVMSHDAARPSLAGVVFDPARRWVWSCDGHRALVASVDGQTSGEPGATPGGKVEGSEPVMVPGAVVSGAVKSCRSKDVVIFDVAPGKAGPSWRVYSPMAPGSWDHGDQNTTIETIAAGGTAGPGGAWEPPAGVTVAPIAQVLPNYERHAPTKPAPMVGINPRYLAEVSELAKIQPDRCVPVRFWHADSEDPILLILDTDHGVTWRMLIMPMRV